jgi:hypothetical protein
LSEIACIRRLPPAGIAFNLQLFRFPARRSRSQRDPGLLANQLRRHTAFGRFPPAAGSTVARPAGVWDPNPGEFLRLTIDMPYEPTRRTSRDGERTRAGTGKNVAAQSPTGHRRIRCHTSLIGRSGMVAGATVDGVRSPEGRQGVLISGSEPAQILERSPIGRTATRTHAAYDYGLDRTVEISRLARRILGLRAPMSTQNRESRGCEDAEPTSMIAEATARSRFVGAGWSGILNSCGPQKRRPSRNRRLERSSRAILSVHAALNARLRRLCLQNNPSRRQRRCISWVPVRMGKSPMAGRFGPRTQCDAGPQEPPHSNRSRNRCFMRLGVRMMVQTCV